MVIADARDPYLVNVYTDGYYNPSEYKLNNVYPNPFNPVTNISFEVPEYSVVKIAIYDIRGAELTVLTDGYMDSGKHEIIWNASLYSSGIYFVRMIILDQMHTQKITLLK